MRPVIISVFFILSGLVAKSQGEFNNWLFGQTAGLTFNAVSPAPVTGSAMASSEGTASISDAAGNLLFYSDGTSIWNKTNAVMLNGNNILGDPSTTQGCLIVPMPGNASRYYLFTLTDQTKAGDLRYSIIDMTLDGGKGGVVTTSKNVLVSTGQTEKMAAAKASACGVWVITHKRLEQFFEARLITNAGVQPPVVSAIGSVHTSAAGTMKVSRDNSKIAVAVVNGSLELFDFDNSSGLLTNVVTLPVNPGRATYSACFSADSKKLYVCEGAANGSIDFYQYDILNTAAAIIASKTFVKTIFVQLPYIDIQLGPDNKLYLSKVGLNCLDVIPSPNLKAPLCGYIENGICLGPGKNASLGLPNDIRIQDKVLTVNLGPDVALCPNASYVLTAPPASPGILWSTGATTQSITVNANGIYWLEVNNGMCKARDSIKVQFTGNNVDLGEDTAVCEANSILINPGNYASYLWQNNSNASTFTVTTPGLYWVQVTDNCGVTSRDSIIVSKKIYTIPGSPDRTRCTPDTVMLHGPDNFISYAWSPNYDISSTSGVAVSVTPSVDTTYFLKTEKIAGCFAYDTIHIKVRNPRQVMIGSDTAICAGEFLKIDAGNTFNSYQWSNGATASFIEVDKRDLYWVQVTDENGCTTRDSIKMEWKACEPALWVPNAFTPNGDGKNDQLKVLSKGYFLQFDFRVFNRWGQIVYFSIDPHQSWDGNYHGNKLPTDTYVWSCTYQLYGQGKKTEKGTITLIR